MDINKVIERLAEYILKFEETKSLNDSRKAAEAFCRIILLNSTLESGINKATETNLNTLIDSLNQKNVDVPENHLKRIKDDLRTIQTFGNIESHDNEDILENSDIDRVSQALNSLIKLVFSSKDKIYIDEKIPEGIYRKIHKSIVGDENWRCEKIISIVYPNRHVFKREVSKDFEFYGLDEADGRRVGLLFLGRNIGFKQTFEAVSQIVELKTLSSLTFLFPVEISEATGTPVKNRKENIERISKDSFLKLPNIKCTYEFIEDYIWDRCLPNNAKEIIEPTVEPYFIDQNLFSDDMNVLSLDFIGSLAKNKIKEKKPIYVIFGDGGTGKTTFCDQSVQLINKYQRDGLKKKVILISSFDIPDEISTSGVVIDSLQSLHALTSDEDNLIDPHSLGLNVSSGNILVIIDGLDEIQSKLKERFVLEKFIESVRDLNDTYQNCSVLMTSREISRKSFESDDIHIFRINGFDEQLVNKYLKKRFKENSSSTKLSDLARDYINNLESGLQVTPLILRLACDLVDDGEPKSLKNQSSQYFKLNESLDKVVYQLMSREIGKQFLGIKTCDEYFEILRDIVIQYDSRVNEVQLLDLVAIALAGSGKDNSGISNNYHTSTLLSKNNEIFSVKYEALEFWIKARYLTYVINNNEVENDINVKKVLARECFRGGALVDEICKHKHQDSAYEFSVIREHSRSLTQKDDEILFRKLISALLYISFKNFPGDRQSYSRRILEIFLTQENEEVNNISIFGEFYPLDFSIFKVRYGYFNGFSSLARSHIPENETIFYSSRFVDFDTSIFGKRQIFNNNFDSECIFSDEFKEMIVLTSEDKEKRRESVILDLKKIFRVGFKGVGFSWKSESVYKQQCASLKIKMGLQNILLFLIREGILVKESSKSSSGEGFKVEQQYHLEIKEFLTQSLISEKIDQLITNLVDL